MDHNLLHLFARIRAFCITLALLLLPGAMQAEDVYLLTAQNINGTEGNYNVPSKHQFTNTSGSVYTYTITSMPATGFSFRIGVNGWENNMQPYQNDDALNINGDSYTISENCYGKDKAWKVSYTDGEYKSLTITVDLNSSNRYVKITGTKNGSTGGGTTTTCTPVSISLEITLVRQGTSTSTSCNATKISNTIFRSMPLTGQNGAMSKVMIPETALTIIKSARLARHITWCMWTTKATRPITILLPTATHSQAAIPTQAAIRQTIFLLPH